jgi:hypothetical protein
MYPNIIYLEKSTGKKQILEPKLDTDRQKQLDKQTDRKAEKLKTERYIKHFDWDNFI